MLLAITAALGLLIILYSLLRHFTGIRLNDGQEKLFIDAVFIGALGLFIYNRKMAGDEKKAKEAARAAETQYDETNV